MIVEPLRPMLQEGLGVLDVQMAAIEHTLSQRLRAAQRRGLELITNRVTRLAVGWQEIRRDEPELYAQIKAFTERVRGLQRPAKARQVVRR